MESTPRFVLPPRPTPPDEGTKEHERWCRESSISYEGGSLTTAYGNIVQVWGPGETPLATMGVDVNRKSYEAKRTNKIGGTEKTIKVDAKTYKKYPKVNSGLAAGGEVYTFVTSEGDFTARVTGDVQDLVKQLTEQRLQQYISFSFHTGSGAKYGEFTPLAVSI